MRAFSLVELSIVLVILGLLTGGILAGQSLIRASELRSVVTDVQRFQSAVYSFRDKYNGIPGDLRNATRFWTSAGGTGDDIACIDAQSGGSAATCNGTGDGQVRSTPGYLYSERFLAWKHLANAGLIEGSYTGKTTGALGSYGASPGINVPASKIGQASWDLFYMSEAGSLTSYFSGTQFDTNMLTFFYSSMSPENMWGIDTKLDDGSPVYGKVTVTRPSAASTPVLRRMQTLQRTTWPAAAHSAYRPSCYDSGHLKMWMQALLHVPTSAALSPLIPTRVRKEGSDTRPLPRAYHHEV